MVCAVGRIISFSARKVSTMSSPPIDVISARASAVSSGDWQFFLHQDVAGVEPSIDSHRVPPVTDSPERSPRNRRGTAILWQE
jgi:hypothetical protein